MKEYVAGWDGGGTKTAIQIRDLEGHVIHSAQGGALNYNSLSKEVLDENIRYLVKEMKQVAGTLEAYRSICISTAGLANKEAKAFLNTAIKDAGVKGEFTLVGDHETALYGALGKSEGIVLISGTGSICFGNNRVGKNFRVGGWGHLIDDEGSGYAIGRDILTAAVRYYDKRSRESILYEAVLEEINGESVEDIIEFTYSRVKSKKDIANIAPLLLAAIEKNDCQALDICTKAANELVNLVVPVAKELSLEEGEIAFLGGILTHYKPIRDKVISGLSRRLPNLKVKEPLHSSVTGATLMALEKAKS